MLEKAENQSGSGTGTLERLQWARIGVVQSEKPKYSAYIKEILSHAGLSVEWFNADNYLDHLDRMTLLILSGINDLQAEDEGLLTQFVGSGGIVIGVGSTSRVPRLFGVEQSIAEEIIPVGEASLGEGYVLASGEHPITSSLNNPVHFFGGEPVKAVQAEVLAAIMNSHQNAAESAGVTLRKIGSGYAILIAVDVPGSVIRIQQGVPIAFDGVSAPDGTANINDCILQSEDGSVLDWKYDRTNNSAGFPYFNNPSSDILKELLIKAIIWGSLEQKAVLPIVWYYPRNLDAVGHIGLISHTNNGDEAKIAMHFARQIGIPGTWYVRQPGFPLDIFRFIKQYDHEVAFSYDAVSAGAWSEERLKVQLTALKRNTAEPIIISNRNYMNRWEGYTDFYNWLDRNDIRLDTSRGPSKPGNAGFLFGSCHPYQPYLPETGICKVFELPFHAANPGSLTPLETSAAIIEKSAKHYGIAHFTFSIEQFQDTDATEALRNIVILARGRKFEWMKASDISYWERARRQLKVGLRDMNDGISFSVMAEDKMDDATILFVCPRRMSANILGKQKVTETTERYGFELQSLSFNLKGKLMIEAVLR